MKNFLTKKQDNAGLKELKNIRFDGLTFSDVNTHDEAHRGRLTELILFTLNNNQATILEMIKKESDARLLEAKAIAIKEAETFIATNK